MLYEKNGDVVETGDAFLYVEEIYLKFPNRYELFRVKKYMSKKEINRPTTYTFNPKLQCKIIRYWLLDTAPEKYLITNGFKPLK